MASRRSLLQGLCTAGIAGIATSAWAGEVRQVATVQGIGAPAGISRLLYNENPLGPSPLAIKAAAEAAAVSNRYPMEKVFELMSSLHRMHGLSFELPDDLANLKALFEAEKQSSILLGVGSTELLRGVALAYGSEGGDFIEAVPGYPAVSDTAEQTWGSKIKRVKVPLTEDYRYDWQAMARAVTPRTRVVVVTNPNNPTGTALSADELTRLADSLDGKALLVIDEAYIDLATAPGITSMVNLTRTHPNVLITRTFSKIHGLAGMRMGYGIGSPQVITRVRPFMMNMLGTNAPAVAASIAALADRDHQARSLQVAEQARAQLLSKLPTLGYEPVPSQANFVWIDIKKDCSEVVERLESRGVLIAGGQRWNLPNYIRISVGQPPEMAALFAALGV